MKKKHTPTKSQEDLLTIIRKVRRKYKKEPTVEMLADYFNCHVSNMYNRLKKLRDNGWIKRKTCLKNPNNYNYLKYKKSRL